MLRCLVKYAQRILIATAQPMLLQSVPTPYLQQEEWYACCLKLWLQLPQPLQHEHKLTRTTAQELCHLHTTRTHSACT